MHRDGDDVLPVRPVRRAEPRRKGAARFAADRLLRLGLPFLFNVLVLMPIAIYPVFNRLSPDAGVADYLAAYRNLPFLPNGPTWFLWLLIAFSPRARLVLQLRAEDARRLLARSGGGRTASAAAFSVDRSLAPPRRWPICRWR